MKALHNTHLMQSCGLGEVGFFRSNKEAGWEGEDLKTLIPRGGAGWFISSFTNQRAGYKLAYEQLCRRFTLVFQSSVRINERTGREFFFCIFDTRKT